MMKTWSGLTRVTRLLLVFIVLSNLIATHSSQRLPRNVSPGNQLIQVRKCCPPGQVMVETASVLPQCQSHNASLHWLPNAVLDNGETHDFAYYESGIEIKSLSEADVNVTGQFCSKNGPDLCVQPTYGAPTCGPARAWPVYAYEGSHDGFQLTGSEGLLRHLVLDPATGQSILHYDYPPQDYCVDRIIFHMGRNAHGVRDPNYEPPQQSFYGVLCEPGSPTGGDFFEFLVSFIYPIGLGIGIALYATTCIILASIRELRDLQGCMTISLLLTCLCNFVCKLILVLDDTSPRINLLILECCLHAFDLAAHFWVNAMGHRAWKATRNPRVELTRPETKRFVYYSFYAWGGAIFTVLFAVLVHLLLDHSTYSPHTPFSWYRLGWLGMAVLCTASAALLLCNIYFYVNTRNTLRYLNAYGRSYHRNKAFYSAFLRTAVTVSIVWFFQSLAWSQYQALICISIALDCCVAPVLIWVLLRHKEVYHLFKNQCSCCQSKPASTNGYWGEELINVSRETGI